MRVRSIRLLAGVPEEQFIALTAVGLDLIAEHVAELELAASTLVSSCRWRGSEAIRVVSEEEAAKFLILLDAVRCDRRWQARKSDQLERFNKHLVKGIYAKTSDIRPASYGEVLSYIDHLRRSHYLDGPNDVDWIFRNDIEAAREARLYIDYVDTDEGPRWQSPQANDEVASMFGSVPGTSSVVELVAAMKRAGFADPSGLQLVAKIWRGFDPQPATHWTEVAQLNNQTLLELAEAGLTAPDFSNADARCVVNTWSFPLHGADLSAIKINPDALREQQRNWSPEL